jgi:hypothetical protein
MKVKISYTTELDNVPYECHRLLSYKFDEVTEIDDSLESIYKDLKVENGALLSLDKIHKLRLLLADYDETLADVQTILQGWANIRLQSHQKDVTFNTEEKEQQFDAQKMLSNLKALKTLSEENKDSIEQD